MADCLLAVGGHAEGDGGIVAGGIAAKEAERACKDERVGLVEQADLLGLEPAVLPEEEDQSALDGVQQGPIAGRGPSLLGAGLALPGSGRVEVDGRRSGGGWQCEERVWMPGSGYTSGSWPSSWRERLPAARRASALMAFSRCLLGRFTPSKPWIQAKRFMCWYLAWGVEACGACAPGHEHFLNSV